MSERRNHLDQAIGFEVEEWTAPIIPNQSEMTGHYCRLELLDEQTHSQSLFDANALDVEGRNWTYMFCGPFDSIENYRSWVQAACSDTQTCFYAIIDKTANRAVGVASYLRIDPSVGCIEVGNICYSPLMQKSRMATEAMYLMMKNVFELGYRRYEWKCDALNTPSRIAALRLGFQYEGIFRQATMYKNRNRDTAWFAVIDKDWPELKTRFEKWLAKDNFDAMGNQLASL